MQIGPWQVDLFPAGFFGLDGGAMFGTVPKVLWSRLLPPDAENRIPMTCNALLLRDGTHTVVVETGCGDKGDAVFCERMALREPDGLLRGLAERGVAPEAVTHVLLTHLHLDHAGGATRRVAGRVVPTFPRARHLVQRSELDEALNPAPRARPSYLPDDFRPLLEAGLLETVDGPAEVLPGLSVRPLPGHNTGNQGVFVQGQGFKLVYPGDLIPTRHHLPPTWAMAYDLDVNTCVATRQALLDELCGTEDLLALDHELDHPVGRVRKDAKGRFVFEPIVLGEALGL